VISMPSGSSFRSCRETSQPRPTAQRARRRIEADLKREYQVDLLDFYRGTLSARRLGCMCGNCRRIRRRSRTINGNAPPWNRNENLIADLWALWAKQDHPDARRNVAKRSAERSWQGLSS
jgi:hypothetical protein